MTLSSFGASSREGVGVTVFADFLALGDVDCTRRGLAAFLALGFARRVGFVALPARDFADRADFAAWPVVLFALFALAFGRFAGFLRFLPLSFFAAIQATLHAPGFS